MISQASERAELLARFRSVAHWQGFDDEDTDPVAQHFLDHSLVNLPDVCDTPLPASAHMDGF